MASDQPSRVTRIDVALGIRVLDCDKPRGFAVWDDLDDDPSPVFRTVEAAVAYAEELAADRKVETDD